MMPNSRFFVVARRGASTIHTLLMHVYVDAGRVGRGVCVFLASGYREWCAVCLDLSRSWLFLPDGY